MAEPPFGVIWSRLCTGKVVPFLGAGASMVGRPKKARWSAEGSAFLPTGDELSEYLAGVTSFPSASAADRRDLARVASYYADTNGRPVLNDELRQILARAHVHGPLHTLLASLDKPQLIVSTNYDTLIERAFDERRKPYDLVVYTSEDKENAAAVLWTPAGADGPQPVKPNELFIDLETTTVIFKMHGSVGGAGAAPDDFVVTEEDYIDFLARMTRNTAIPSILFEHFRDRHFLFLGYSLQDWNLRVILRNLAPLWKPDKAKSGLPSWAIQERSTELEKTLWKSRGVSIFDMPLDDFTQALQRVAAGTP